MRADIPGRHCQPPPTSDSRNGLDMCVRETGWPSFGDGWPFIFDGKFAIAGKRNPSERNFMIFI
jgi:hypothetical protein